eukprot:SAG31_NODE_8743_length_1395_cov_8.237617_4_plen_32_part_01
MYGGTGAPPANFQLYDRCVKTKSKQNEEWNDA